jgi:hypothetical protein
MMLIIDERLDYSLEVRNLGLFGFGTWTGSIECLDEILFHLETEAASRLKLEWCGQKYFWREENESADVAPP